MGFTAAGISTSTVTTTQQAPLGFVLTVPNQTTAGDSGYGMQEWVYVKTSAAMAKGNVCGRAVGAITQPFIVGLSVAADTRAGVVGRRRWRSDTLCRWRRRKGSWSGVRG